MDILEKIKKLNDEELEKFAKTKIEELEKNAKIINKDIDTIGYILDYNPSEFNLLDKGELFADIMNCESKGMDIIEAIKRALVDQMKCNDKITGISIGTNEAPRGEKYNEWRKVIEDSDADWTNCIYWIKFEYLFKNKTYGISHKEYRARFIVEGEGQYINNPNRYITQEERDWQRSQKRRYRRYGGWW